MITVTPNRLLLSSEQFDVHHLLALYDCSHCHLNDVMFSMYVLYVCVKWCVVCMCEYMQCMSTFSFSSLILRLRPTIPKVPPVVSYCWENQKVYVVLKGIEIAESSCIRLELGLGVINGMTEATSNFIACVHTQPHNVGLKM